MELELDDDHSPISPPSFKTKLKHSLCFSCCFRRHNHGHGHRQVVDSPPPSFSATAVPSDEKPAVVWLKKKVSHDLKEDIKDRCTTLFSRISKHKRHSSAEFRYDPLSYSLNFEDGFDGDDEAPLRNFSSRLPPSPPVKPVPSIREITAVG